MRNPTKIKRILRNINLHQHPALNHTAQELFAFGSHRDWVTLGDAHANPLKILYFLIAMGVVQFKNRADQVTAYADFHEYCSEQIKFAMDCQQSMYQAGLPPVDPMHFSALGHFLDVAPGSKFRAIGDELADRWLTGDDSVLALLSAFQDEKGQLESILSNHVATFIQLFEYAYTAYENHRISDQPIENQLYEGYLALCNHPEAIVAYQQYEKLVITNIERADTVFIDAFSDACDILATVRTWDPNQEIVKEDRSFYASSHTLLHKLKSGSATVETLIKDYERHKKTFKVFSYDYVELDGKPRIYSHADTSRYTICLVTGQFYSTDLLTDAEATAYEAMRDRNPHLENIHTLDDLKPYENTPIISNADLYHCIDICNAVISRQATQNKMAALFSNNGHATPLMRCLENRENTLDRTIHNIHGHDPQENNDHHESLDDLSGKHEYSEDHKHSMTAYYQSKRFSDPQGLVYGMAYTKTPSTPGTAKPIILRGRPLTRESDNKKREHALSPLSRKDFQ